MQTNKFLTSQSWHQLCWGTVSVCHMYFGECCVSPLLFLFLLIPQDCYSLSQNTLTPALLYWWMSLWCRSAASKEKEFSKTWISMCKALLKLYLLWFWMFAMIYLVIIATVSTLRQKDVVNVSTHSVISSISGCFYLFGRTRQEWWHSSNNFHVGFLAAAGSRQARCRASKHYGKDSFKAASCIMISRKKLLIKDPLNYYIIFQHEGCKIVKYWITVGKIPSML